MGKYNGCIYLLSSRKKILKKCLELLYKNYNHRYQYPVYIYYFDNIYTKSFIKEIKKDIGPDINFIQLPYKIPEFIDEKDLFYNRNNEYAKKFTKERVGYLHMENFVCNLQALEELKKYDYYHRIDDDSWFKKPITFNLFDKMISGGYPMATSQTWSRFSQGILDVRENLFEFTKNYCEKNNIIPKSKQLREALKYNDKKKFHLLGWSSGNCNLYDMKFFRTNSWYNLIGAVNKYGGCYKHRWGDQEIIGLFTYIYFDKPILNLKLVDKGLYSPRLPETMTAPTTKKDGGNILEKSIVFFKKAKNKIINILENK